VLLTCLTTKFLFAVACTYRGVTRGGKGGTIPWALNHHVGANHCRGAEKSQKCHKYFLQCSSLHLLPKDFRSEHGGVKLASCPGRHITSLRFCAYSQAKNWNQNDKPTEHWSKTALHWSVHKRSQGGPR